MSDTFAFQFVYDTFLFKRCALAPTSKQVLDNILLIFEESSGLKKLCITAMGVNNVAEGAEMLQGEVACMDQESQVW